jgi:hypothetical protein
VVVGDVLHLSDVEADAAEECRDPGLEAGAGAVRDDRDALGVAEFADLGTRLHMVMEIFSTKKMSLKSWHFGLKMHQILLKKIILILLFKKIAYFFSKKLKHGPLKKPRSML